MKVKAAVAHQAGAPLVIETVDLDGPKAGEVLVEIKATGVCHTDEFTRSGADRHYPSKLVNFLSASTKVGQFEAKFNIQPSGLKL